MPAARKNPARRERGFTLVEMMLATVVILVGLVAVAQLVPVAVLLNSANRMDSTSLVIAQRQLEQLMSQPIGNTTFQDPAGLTCPSGDTCDLGGPAPPSGTVVGAPIATAGGSPLIDFSSAAVDKYSFQSVDPNDPIGALYDVRWAVITTKNGSAAIAKRFIVGVRKVGGNGFFPPVTLDSAVRQ